MKTLLLVDDDHELLGLVARFLKGSGYDCVQADTLEAAIGHVDGDHEFSGAVVDFWIGTSNAIPLLDVLHAIDPTMPVILMSGGGGGVSLEMTQAIGEISGAVHFLQKPFRRADLIELLDHVD